MKHIKTAIILALAISLCLIACSKKESAFDRDIQEYLDILGANETANSMLEELLEQWDTDILPAIKAELPEASEEYWEQWREEIISRYDTIWSETQQEWKRHLKDIYSHNDLKKLIAFYQSDAGNKLLQLNMTLFDEVQQITEIDIYVSNPALRDEIDENILAIIDYMGIIDDEVDSILTLYQEMFPGMPDSFWAEQREVIIESMEETRLAIAMVYRKAFSGDEIKELLEFYSSELGETLLLGQIEIENTLDAFEPKIVDMMENLIDEVYQNSEN